MKVVMRHQEDGHPISGHSDREGWGREPPLWGESRKRPLRPQEELGPN